MDWANASSNMPWRGPVAFPDWYRRTARTVRTTKSESVNLHRVPRILPDLDLASGLSQRQYPSLALSLSFGWFGRVTLMLRQSSWLSLSDW